MKNPFQYKLTILDRGEEHFSGKKKPWENRVEYPPTVAIIYLVQFAVFLLLIWLLPEWRTVVILFAGFALWGLAEATKSKYYRIGYYDAMQDRAANDSERESEE